MEMRYTATIDTLRYDDLTPVDYPCKVDLDENELTVFYHWDDNGHFIAVIYRGKEVAPGHFELAAPMVDGYATLHCMPGSNVFVGEKVEHGVRAMWKVVLHLHLRGFR